MRDRRRKGKRWNGGNEGLERRISYGLSADSFGSEVPRLRNIAVEANDIGKTSDIRFKGARSW